MAANYDFVENPNPYNEDEAQPLHPRIVSKGTIPTKKIIKQVAFSCSLTEGDMKSALSALAYYLADYLKEGYTVELGDIGYFSATLKARQVMTKSEIRAASVQFDNVNFRAKKSFRNELSDGELVRSRFGFNKSRSLTPEERLNLLNDFLDNNMIITRAEYTNLTGRLKGMALKDLKEWVAQGILTTRGSRNNRVYLRVKKE